MRRCHENRLRRVVSSSLISLAVRLQTFVDWSIETFGDPQWWTSSSLTRYVCELQPPLHYKVVSAHPTGEMRLAIETITAGLALFTMSQYG